MPSPDTLIDFAESALGVPLMPWQRAFMTERVEPEPAAPVPEWDRVKPHGDPTLGGDGTLLPVDADCPGCGWPERTYSTVTRHFGCIRCDYVSDERNA